MKRARLNVLAINPLYTERFASYVDPPVRSGCSKYIVEKLNLRRDTVNELKEQCLRAQPLHRRQWTPNVIGLGFAEALNRKIRVIQRRAHGLAANECARLTLVGFAAQALGDDAKIRALPSDRPWCHVGPARMRNSPTSTVA